MNATPINDSPLLAIANWIAQLLTGGVGIATAVLAIAAVGVAMLLGHLPMRYGTRLALGCFALFSAPAIAQTLTEFTRLASSETTPDQAYSAPPLSLPEPQKLNRAPYEGASVPM